MNEYLLTVDQGTTSTRAILFNHDGQIVAKAQREINNYFPHEAWVEQDALEIYVSTMDVINELKVRTNLRADQVAAIGITNQRETTIVWDKETGLPIYNAIVWQSKQTRDICEKIRDKEEMIKEKTGLILNPYFSASKIRFILDNVPGAQERAEKGELMAGTVDSWLLYKLTKGEVHATDYSNASRTLLFNIHDLKWDEDLCKLFNIPMCMLPEVHDSSYNYGKTTILAHNHLVPITGIAGDQQASLFGQNCFAPGDVKNTYGTGCFVLMNTGSEVVKSKYGLLSTIAWGVNGKVEYALEGSVLIGGASIQWLRDQLKMIENAAQSEEVVKSIDNEENIYVVPAFVGLGTPYWDDHVRGAMFGLTRGTTYKNIVKATLQAIAYQSKDVIEAMKKDVHCKLKTLKVDGGATANHYLMQFQADILNTKIKRPVVAETTALGAAYLAGLCVGYYKDIEEIKSIHQYKDHYKPQMSSTERKTKYDGWKRAVKAARVF